MIRKEKVPLLNIKQVESQSRDNGPTLRDLVGMENSGSARSLPIIRLSHDAFKDRLSHRPATKPIMPSLHTDRRCQKRISENEYLMKFKPKLTRSSWSSLSLGPPVLTTSIRAEERNANTITKLQERDLPRIIDYTPKTLNPVVHPSPFCALYSKS